MKKTCVTVFALLGIAAAANGFTLNFIGQAPYVFPPDLVISVPGYGPVQFTPLAGSALVVGTKYQTGGVPTPSLEFDSGEIVLVSFLGPVVSDLSFDFIDVSPGESMNVNPGGANAFTVQLTGGSNGAGLQEITFSAVPETSTGMLGMVAATLCFARRRR